MTATDDRNDVLAQRERARRALVRADTAMVRLREARARAEDLLHRSGGEPSGEDDEASGGATDTPEDALRRRMRVIEDRMQRTDSRMRTGTAHDDGVHATDPDTSTEPRR